MDLATLETLFRYNEWANEQMFAAVAAVAPDDFARSASPSQGSLRDTLTHIVWSEWIWLQRWTGVTDLVFQPADFGQVPRHLVFVATDFPDAASLRERSRAIGADLLAFVRRLSPDDLPRIHSHRTPSGHLWDRSLWRLLLHAVNHSTYHRGQVAMMLRQIGCAPAATDFVTYEG